MKLEGMPHVYLCMWICLISNNVFVLTAPSKLHFNDGIKVLRDSNSAKENGLNAMVKYTAKLYKSLQQERGNRGLVAMDLESDTGRPQTIDVTRIKAFKHADPRQHINGIDTLYDLPVHVKVRGPVNNADFSNKVSSALESHPGKTVDYTGKKQMATALLDLLAMKRDSINEDKFGDMLQRPDKRKDINCDVTKLTLNMLVEYFRNKTLCGRRALQIRFGLGR